MKSKAAGGAAVVAALIAIPLAWSYLMPVLNPAPSAVTPAAVAQAATPVPTSSHTPLVNDKQLADISNKVIGGITKAAEGIAGSANSATPQDSRGTEWDGVTFTSTQATAALREMAVSPEGSMSGYSRSDFPTWTPNALGAGCNTRDAVLYREAQHPSIGNHCKITGVWREPYDGKTVTDGSKLDIDHSVPLAEAWRTGARSWSLGQRTKYANDPLVTVAVDASANREKGDKAPEDWKPANRGAWCEYSVRWVQVKSVYHLTATQPEVDALREMLASCA